MMKQILSILFICIIACAPCNVFASGIEIQDTELIGQEIRLTIDGRTVYVQGAEGKTLVVYDVAGNEIMKTEIDSDSKQININAPRGLYIIRVGSVTRKVQIR